MALKISIVAVTPFQQNCALIWDGDTAKGAVIDPGGDVPKILQAIKTSGATVENIFLTHGHLDHAGGAAELAAALNVPIFGPDRRDEMLIADLPSQGGRFGMQPKSFTPEKWLSEGEVVSMGGHEFSVLHCPGHTPGHIVFINHADKFAVVGDVLFRNSVGRTDFPYGDHQALISAITEKLLPLGDDFVFICGHGLGSTFGKQRQTNPFLQ
jgi:glyoxylase-like metal-dependent hydrolase (beta-lactamase superfamily II)